jgi:diadenosine tetraphosphatase ApaH/serine/threonine PP2A family protein phosphatase
MVIRITRGNTQQTDDVNRLPLIPKANALPGHPESGPEPLNGVAPCVWEGDARCHDRAPQILPNQDRLEKAEAVVYPAGHVHPVHQFLDSADAITGPQIWHHQPWIDSVLQS